MNEPIELNTELSANSGSDPGSVRDPLGLSQLPDIEPGPDDWPEIESVLRADQQSRHNRWRIAGSLAAAASVVMVIGILLNLPGGLVVGVSPQTGTEVASTTPLPEPFPDQQPTSNEQMLTSLIGLSQQMESQLRVLRTGATSVSANCSWDRERI